MRDMTLNFKRDLSVFYRGKLCITENESKMLCRIFQKNSPRNSPSVQGSNDPVYISPVLWGHRLNHKMID